MAGPNDRASDAVEAERAAARSAVRQGEDRTARGVALMSDQWKIMNSIPVKVSAIGADLGEAYENLMADQAVTFDDVVSFEVLSSRRVSSRYMPGAKMYEVWEFEVFCHGS